MMAARTVPRIEAWWQGHRKLRYALIAAAVAFLAWQTASWLTHRAEAYAQTVLVPKLTAQVQAIVERAVADELKKKAAGIAGGLFKP